MCLVFSLLKPLSLHRSAPLSFARSSTRLLPLCCLLLLTLLCPFYSPPHHPAMVSSHRWQICSSRKPQPLDHIADVEDGSTINTTHRRSSWPLPYSSPLQKIHGYYPPHSSILIPPSYALSCCIPPFIHPYPSYPASSSLLRATSLILSYRHQPQHLLLAALFLTYRFKHEYTRTKKDKLGLHAHAHIHLYTDCCSQHKFSLFYTYVKSKVEKNGHRHNWDQHLVFLSETHTHTHSHVHKHRDVQQGLLTGQFGDSGKLIERGRGCISI